MSKISYNLCTLIHQRASATISFTIGQIAYQLYHVKVLTFVATALTLIFL